MELFVLRDTHLPRDLARIDRRVADVEHAASPTHSETKCAEVLIWPTRAERGEACGDIRFRGTSHIGDAPAAVQPGCKGIHRICRWHLIDIHGHGRREIGGGHDFDAALALDGADHLREWLPCDVHRDEPPTGDPFPHADDQENGGNAEEELLPSGIHIP